jgi:hypothetical protein
MSPTGKRKALGRTAFLAAALLTGLVVPVSAQADGGCIPGDQPGSVPRNARPGDMVCVSPQTAGLIQQESATAAEKVDPNGAYGPQSCKQGFVWREAFDGDTVCVTPQRRQETWQQNANAGVGATGGLAPQPVAAACEWKYGGTNVLELDNGNLVELDFGNLSARQPMRMIVKDRFGSLTVYPGEIYSGSTDDKKGETFFGIIWRNYRDNSRAGGTDFDGKVDPASGTLSGTYENHDGPSGQWKARERFTCG